MSLASDQILAAVQSHAMSLGVFDSTSDHESLAPQGPGVHLEVFGGGFDLLPMRSGLAVASVKLTLRVRLRTSWLQKSADDIDKRLLQAVDPLMAAYIGDFNLGGLIESVDILGSAGTPLAGQFGYLDQGGQMFRTLEIQLPLIVNDLWTEAP